MRFTLFLLAACAAGCAVPADVDQEQDDLTQTHKFTCTVDSARLDPYEHQHFDSVEMSVSAKKVKISKLVLSERLKAEIDQIMVNRLGDLAAGIDAEGKPLSKADKAAITAYVAKLGDIVRAAKAQQIVFTGKMKPYVKPPKVPTVQYPLEVSGGGIDAAVLWDLIGNEGWGGRALIRPAMLNGEPGKPDVEWEGYQGPLWDRFDCK